MVWEGMNILLKMVPSFVGEKQYKQSYLGHSSYCKHPKESLLITATHKGPGFNHRMSWSQGEKVEEEFFWIVEIRILATSCILTCI
jgi:hypothetical protein